jgi:hypothetical protein
MPTPAFETIRAAIEQKCSVSAIYQGHYREMSPYVLGYKDGHEHALLYQYGGTSSSGLGPVGSGRNWRCVFVAQLSEVKLIENVFETAPSTHSRPQTCVDDWVAVIEY